MSELKLVTQTYFISSGMKNAMYTLRVLRKGGMYCSDNYICNLSTDPDKAEAKAKEYFDSVAARLTETEFFKLNFCGFADFDLFERRNIGVKVLSVEETERLESIERGIMPFGKNVGKVLADLPMNTILWWADQSKECNESASQNIIFQAVCSACMGIALEKGYIEKRDAIKQERIERDSKSDYIGEVKKRLDLKGKVELVISLGFHQVSYYTEVEKYMTKIRVGDNIVVYFGNKVAEQSEEIEFRATVKAHSEYEGVKQTTVNRVKVM